MVRPIHSLAEGSDPRLCGEARFAPGAAADFPAIGAANQQGLVSVHWLKRLLDQAASRGHAGRPGVWRAHDILVVEAHWGGLAQCGHAAHVPGAIALDTDDLETPGPQWRLCGDETLQRTIGRHGIGPLTTVIVYGRDQTAAARAWWVLRYAGVRDVRLLDGGIAAWMQAGYPVDRRPGKPSAVEFSAPVEPALLASTGYVRERLEDPGVWFADVRSRAEFEGRKSGYYYIDATGRLPGALHVDDADDEARMYVRRDGHLRAPRDILALWRARGLVPAPGGKRFEREVVFYCGTGWRSSLAVFYAWLLGFENIRNYSDGWSGWSTEYHQDPHARGDTPGWRQQPTGNPVERDIA